MPSQYGSSIPSELLFVAFLGRFACLSTCMLYPRHMYCSSACQYAALKRISRYKPGGETHFKLAVWYTFGRHLCQVFGCQMFATNTSAHLKTLLTRLSRSTDMKWCQIVFCVRKIPDSSLYRVSIDCNTACPDNIYGPGHLRCCRLP